MAAMALRGLFKQACMGNGCVMRRRATMDADGVNGKKQRFHSLGVVVDSPCSHDAFVSSSVEYDSP